MAFNMLRPSCLLHQVLKMNKSFTMVIPNIKMSTAENMKMKNEPKSDSTINPEEIKKFSQNAEQWWDLQGSHKALHSMNEIRVPFIRDGLVHLPPSQRTPTPLKDKKILDVGCGAGILSEALSKIGALVTGIDATKELIEVAKNHSASNTKLSIKPNYICTTIEDHVHERKNYYDGVVASEVIEHVSNKELFVKSCVEAIKPGGRIFFTTPNRTRAAQILGIYVAEYVLGIVPKGTHQYDLFINPNELSFLLERNNCHVEAVYGGVYNVLLNKWEFVSSQVLWYALQAEKLK